MNNVTFIDITEPFTNAVTTYAIIDKGNGEFTSMTKADYDAQQTFGTHPFELVQPAPAEKPKK
jgi:hypothetical protein